MRVAVNTSQKKGEDPDVREAYLSAIRKIGCVPVIISPRDSAVDTFAKMYGCSGLILIGGPDIPPEFYGGRSHPTISEQCAVKTDHDFSLIRMATRIEIPILGICAGMQLLGCYFGGRLLPHIPEAGLSVNHRMQAGRHSLARVSKKLRDITQLENWWVNSRHHQCLECPGELDIDAMSPDGLIEAVSHPKYPIVGVQWHPEDMISEAHSYNLFRALTWGYHV